VPASEVRPLDRVAALLKLTRLPLVFTAIADSAAGYLLTLPPHAQPDAVVMALLAAASACLYACGMVFNDIADALRDRVLYPQRPLPSGRVSARGARTFGLALLVAAALFGGLINFMAGQMVLLIFVLIMAYDFYAKSFTAAGAAAMALVRAANFAMGVLAVAPPSRGAIVIPPWDDAAYAQALVLGVYVFFLTVMSTLEEKALRKHVFALCGLAMAALPLAGLALGRSTGSIIAACALTALLAVHTLASLRALDRAAVMRNVRWGVLAIIAVDASFVMARDWRWGLGVLGLAPPALALLPLFRRL
jgi:4-hydroxybenzoate polyprenyltransferase